MSTFLHTQQHTGALLSLTKGELQAFLLFCPRAFRFLASSEVASTEGALAAVASILTGLSLVRFLNRGISSTEVVSTECVLYI